MVRTVCRAKNPESCRYHGVDADGVALNRVRCLQGLFNSAVSVDKRKMLLVELKEAEEVYDCTDKGFAELKTEYREVQVDGDYFERAKIVSRLIKAKIARNEEKQEGNVSDIVVFNSEDLKSKVSLLEELALSGKSDIFLDEFDKTKVALEQAIVEEDYPHFVSLFNDTLESLGSVAGSVQWVDPKFGVKFQKSLLDAKLSGRFYKNPSIHDSKTIFTV